MAFYAKPSGGYATDSTEWTNNVYTIYNYLSAEGYTMECVSGMLGNMFAESGLNPWRWQNNVVNYSAGYGLMQFTPASGYINLTGIPQHAPNLSTSQQTTGASSDDGYAQLYVFIHDTLSKWYSPLWRSYWDQSAYPDLYNQARNVLIAYGNGSTLTMSQFAGITDVYSSTLAFLGCYEGPAVPNYDTRLFYALHIYDVLGGYTPPGDNILIELKILDVNRKRKFQNI